jgi:serine/threonine protein kinase/tetratricopeptide (TPR) repeat protein
MEWLLMIGNTISNYRILDKLGQGGMGEVFLALDTHLNRKVALKFLKNGRSGDLAARRGLLREARSAALLDHPFICKIYDAVDSDEYDYIAMEYVEGETIRDALHKAPLPPRDVLRIAIEIAEALEVAHEHGIVHRDIKPANIMLGINGHVKVMDFGLAKQSFLAGFSEDETLTSFALTEPGAIVGTLEYMPPEQLRGKKVDGRTDIFSLGITLCEALTGKNPLKQSSQADTISEIISNNPVRLPASPDPAPSIPDKILRRMVEKDPEKRYQSIKDLLVDLRLAQDASIGSEGHRRVRPKLKALQLAGMVLAVIMLLAVLVWYLASPSKPALAFQERDWIVVADFENRTGEGIFDKSLDTALRVSLEQSSYVNLFPRSRIEQTLKRMKRPDVSIIDETIAREIAQREGINIILVPSITGIAGSYMISTTMEDAGSGDRIKSDALQVHGKEGVLPALDKLAEDTRRSLGEKTFAISSRSKQLAKATTPSLAALKQYSLGLEALKASRFEQAKKYFEDTLQLDPNFAAANASLGMINFEKFDSNKGKELLSKAVQMTDNLTVREKYAILATYSEVVENDIPKTIQQWEMLSRMYPDDPIVHNNIGWFCNQVGRYDEAIEEYKEALRIDPYLMLSFNGLATVYLYKTGRVTSGIELCLKEIGVDDRSFWAYNNLGWAYLGTGNLEAARAALEKALQLSENPKGEAAGQGMQYKDTLFRLGHVFRLQGKYNEAVRVLQRIPEMFSDPETDYQIGVVYQLMRDNVAALAHFGKYRQFMDEAIRDHPSNPYPYIQLAFVLQRLGLSEEARSAFQKAADLNPQQHFSFARFYSIAGRTDEALRELEDAIQNGHNNYVWMKVHPDFQNLYKDPRFQALLNQHLK